MGPAEPHNCQRVVARECRDVHGQGADKPRSGDELFDGQLDVLLDADQISARQCPCQLRVSTWVASQTRVSRLNKRRCV